MMSQFLKINKAFPDNNIAVALTVDDNYLAYSKATVRSIITNAPDANLDILIFVYDLSEEKKEEYIASIATRENVSVRIYSIKEYVDNSTLTSIDTGSNCTQAASYRLILGDILDQYDKIVYLDTDTIVLGDISDLYNADLEGNWLAAVVGVQNHEMQNATDERRKWFEKYGSNLTDTYFNAGVLLIDLDAFRTNDLSDRLLSAAAEQLAFPDQDALNAVCNGHVLLLDMTWNVQVLPIFTQLNTDKREEYRALVENAKILHYTTAIKPWNRPGSYLASVWWHYMKDEPGVPELAMNIKLDYFAEWPNFGDLLSRSLIEKLTGGIIDIAPFSECDLMAVGSLLLLNARFFTETPDCYYEETPIHVWGSGFLNGELPQVQLYPTRTIEVHAVRGKNTLSILKRIGVVGEQEQIALGDPGLFYTDLVEGIESIEKQYDIALVPHHLDQEHFREIAEELQARGYNIKLVDILQVNPFEAIREIAAAKKVITSSLHAIIVADTLQIPHIRILARGFADSERHTREQSFFKFEDYYSAFDLDLPRYITEEELLEDPRKVIDSISDADCIPADKIVEKKIELLKAFPYPVANTRECVQQRNEPSDVKLSIIIPEYNNEYWLHDCITSVIGQRQFQDFELILIDDGSTDGSLKKMRSWERFDPRIKVLEQKNAGPGITRNRGINEAKGAYIMFLDSDDRLASGEVLRQAYEKARSLDLDILITDAINIDANGKMKTGRYNDHEYMPTSPVFSGDSIGNQIFITLNLAPWGKLYKTEFIKQNNIVFAPLRRSEDYAFTVVAGMLASRVSVLQKPLICHRISLATSLENTKDQTPLEFVEGDKFMKQELIARGLYDRCKSVICRQVYKRLAYCMYKVKSYASFKEVVQKIPEIYNEYLLPVTDILYNDKQYKYNKEYLETIMLHMESDEYLQTIFERRVNPWITQAAQSTEQQNDSNAADQLCFAIPGKTKEENCSVSLRRVGSFGKYSVAFCVEKNNTKEYYPLIDQNGDREFLVNADVAALQSQMKFELSDDQDNNRNVELRVSGSKDSQAVSFVVAENDKKRFYPLVTASGDRAFASRQDLDKYALLSDFDKQKKALQDTQTNLRDTQKALRDAALQSQMRFRLSDDQDNDRNVELRVSGSHESKAVSFVVIENDKKRFYPLVTASGDRAFASRQDLDKYALLSDFDKQKKALQDTQKALQDTQKALRDAQNSQRNAQQDLQNMQKLRQEDRKVLQETRKALQEAQAAIAVLQRNNVLMKVKRIIKRVFTKLGLMKSEH